MKLKLFITDANILIDLIKLDLIKQLVESNLYQLATTDFVFDELWQEHQEFLENNNVLNYLEIYEPNESDLEEVFKLKRESKALSVQDCSVWYYALKFKASLLTGDKKLRSEVSKQGIEVRGVLFLFDQMLQAEIISPQLAFEKLSLLQKINKWLPKTEVNKRLALWESL